MISFIGPKSSLQTKKAFILSKKGKYSKTLPLEMSARTATAPELLSSRLGCAGFAKKIFTSKRNEAKQSETRSVSNGHAKKCFMLLFASNFSLLTKAKLKQRFITLLRFQKFVVSFHFASKFVRFASKRNKINVFCFVSLQSKTK